METITEKAQSVKVELCSNLSESQAKATSEALNTSGTVIPGILFYQGGRYSFSGAMPVQQIIDKLEIRAAEKSFTAKEVGGSTNRPTEKKHVETIAEYLKDNIKGKYIIPPITLNVQQKMVVFASSETAAICVAYAVLPSTAKLQVTDGGHRQKAIILAYRDMSDEDRETFSTNSISVMITFESDNAQVQQDFADCSKTKKLQPSLIAAYDRRNPANGLALDLIDAIPLFDDKVDSTSTTLSNNSNMIFLVSHIRQYVKELLLKNWKMANAQFDKKARQQLEDRNSQHYKENLTKFVNITRKFTSCIEPFPSLENLPRGPERMKIAQKRKEGWVSMTSTGLSILGRVGHILLRDDFSDHEIDEKIKKLSNIDMRKNADFWADNIVKGDRLLTSSTPVSEAMDKVLNYLGLAENEEEKSE